MITQRDTELIQNTLTGDPKAQEILYEKYSQSVKNFLSKKYSQYYDLEDDVAEIMIKVFMKLHTYDNTKSKFKSWVFSIAKNHVIDKWRTNATICVENTENMNITTSGDSLSIPSNNTYLTSNNADIKLDAGFMSCCNTDFENCSSINFISDQLTPQDFTLLDMKYVQGYDYNEIGCEFNLTSSTVSNRVNYIKSKLKKNNPEIIYE